MEKYLFKDEIIFRSQHFTISQDWETPIAGFFIIAANRPLQSIAELNEIEAAELVRLAIAMRRGMQQILGIEKVYLFQNEDTEHNFHLWLFPRHAWMEELGSKVQSVRKIMNYAEKWIHNFNRDFTLAREQSPPEQKEREKIIAEVRQSAAKMREYMTEFN